MGILDDVLESINPFDGLVGDGRAERRGRRLLEQGERTTGRLLGIRAHSGNESGLTCWWGVEVHVAGGTYRAACRQGMPPGARDVLRLGMPLDLAVQGREVALLWDPSGPGGWGFKKAVDDGVEDDRVPEVKGEPGEAEVHGWRRTTMGGMQVLVEIGGAEPAWHGFFVPEWASHLLAPGTTLPVGVRDGGRRLRPDWAAALERHGTGVGVPMPAPTHPTALDRIEQRAQSLTARLIGAGDPGEGDAPHGVSLEQWLEVSASLLRDRVPPARYDEVAQEHGVPPGGWAPGEAAWKARMLADWRLGTAYGEAMAKAQKG